MRSPNYCVRGPEKGLHQVELWSTGRLSYAPKGWRREMRDELVIALKQMRCEPDGTLYSLYCSIAAEYCDVENILFYNVGCSAFSRSCGSTLIFERSFETPPPPPVVLSGIAKHYHLYVMRKAPATLWSTSRVLAKWSGELNSSPNASMKPHDWWHLTKSSIIQTLHPHSRGQPLGIEVVINGPDCRSPTLVTLMKPLLDGILCGFHFHDGSDLEELSQRLSLALPLTTGELQELLLRQEVSVLGKRRLLHRFKNSVQWNPADDALVSVHLKTIQSGNADWSFSGEISEVSRANAHHH